MKLLESKKELTINELLKIAYEYGNDQADIPSDDVDESFNEWVKNSGDLVKKLNLHSISAK